MVVGRGGVRWSGEKCAVKEMLEDFRKEGLRAYRCAVVEFEPSGSFRVSFKTVCAGHLKFVEYDVSCNWCLMLAVPALSFLIAIEVV
jgi:hypothetical protein